MTLFFFSLDINFLCTTFPSNTTPSKKRNKRIFAILLCGFRRKQPRLNHCLFLVFIPRGETGIKTCSSPLGSAFFLVLFVWGPGVLDFQMRCFSCLQLHRKRDAYEDALLMQHPDSPSGSHSSGNWKRKSNSYSCGLDMMSGKTGDNDAHSFTFLELATATKNFREANLIGEGGFGKVYRGRFDNGQEIAAKRLNSDGHQGNQEFIVEVLMLSLLHHPNLVKLIGYCAEGDHRLLVYEYMRMGSLSDHLYENGIGPILDWNTRMKIAVGAAKGIEYLHCSANPPVIYRDLKSANILLDNEFNPRLSDFGLAKLGPVGDKTHVSTRVMGTYGYCAPDYAMSGKLSIKSDIFSFGVVLLELVTGRSAFDTSRKQGEQSLIAWSRPLIRDRKRSTEMVDPQLEGRFPERAARHLIDLISMLVKEDPNARPPISEIVIALEYLAAESSNAAAASSSSPTVSLQPTNSASACVPPL